MRVIRFRSSEDYDELLHKVKKMKMFAEELESCLEESSYDDDLEYRGGYRMNRDDYYREEMDGRYGYKKNRR